MGKIIIGLDPGTVRTGFAITSMEGDKFSLIEMGVLSAGAKLPLEQRLLKIGQSLELLYKNHSIVETAIEQIFLGKNPDSCFKLAQVVGVCVFQAMKSGSQVSTYPSRFVKKSITGSGAADKEAVKIFVFNIFGVKMQDIPNDATDALAVSLCHIYQLQNQKLSILRR